ncbi:MAG: leucyl/phenylalanyl-tRNA--protein transferase [Brevirhabdus sp.]
MLNDRPSAQLMLQAYAGGVFPMAEGRDDPQIFWVNPKVRGIFPMDGFHISRSLAKRLRQQPFRVTADRDFKSVLDGCADREETWINAPLYSVYSELHALGFAHSIEVWGKNGLAGGVFGIALGGAFFGESMFSRETDASKIALAYLMSRLNHGGFKLFDAQFLTDHLASLGAVELPRAAYQRILANALKERADFHAQSPSVAVEEVLQRRTQTS